MLCEAWKIFLQQMFAWCYISVDDAISMLNKIIVELTGAAPQENIDLKFLNTIIREINQETAPEKIALALTTNEVTGQKNISLVSIAHNTITEAQTFYTEPELAYWLPLMEAIVKADVRSMNRINCLNVVAQHQLQIKLDDAEKFLSKCVQKGYLTLHSGMYYLGDKAMFEFNKELQSLYGDYVQSCELCFNLCCYGKMCINCSKLMHEHCLQKGLSIANECPLCHVRWGEFDFQAQPSTTRASASIQEEDVQALRESQPLRRSQRTKPRA